MEYILCYFLLNGKMSQLYLYIYTLCFVISFPFGHYKALGRVPIYCIHSILHMSIPISRFNPLPQFPPLGVHRFVLYVCVSILTLQICTIFPDSTNLIFLMSIIHYSPLTPINIPTYISLKFENCKGIESYSLWDRTSFIHSFTHLFSIYWSSILCLLLQLVLGMKRWNTMSALKEFLFRETQVTVTQCPAYRDGVR